MKWTLQQLWQRKIYNFNRLFGQVQLLRKGTCKMLLGAESKNGSCQWFNMISFWFLTRSKNTISKWTIFWKTQKKTACQLLLWGSETRSWAICSCQIYDCRQRTKGFPISVSFPMRLFRLLYILKLAWLFQGGAQKWCPASHRGCSKDVRQTMMFRIARPNDVSYDATYNAPLIYVHFILAL